ncbi:MAG: SurA N-terminal domain-containing protein [Nitrospiria bacterium]
MLKNIREGAIENPWFFRIIMLGVAAVFAVSMGWWGFGNDERIDNALAHVGDDTITIDEYTRAYRNESRFYRELFQDDYDDEALRQRVVEALVEQKLWLQEARRMGIVVSDAALRESVTALAAFQTDAKFDPALYQRILSREKFTPERFEAKQREALLIQRVKAIVKNGVSLTPAEIKEAEESDPDNPDPSRTIEARLSQKQERAAKAYVLSLKAKSAIMIKEELL